MSEPQRLLKGDGSDFEVRLLRSAEDDAPPRDLKPKTLAALGIGVGAAGIGAAATAATAAKVALKTGILTWVGFGVASGIVVLAATGLMPSPFASPVAIETPAAKEAAPPRVAPRPVANPAQPAAIEAPAAIPDPPASAAPPSGKSAAAPHLHPSAAPSSALTDEVAAVDAAREALAAGNAALAIQALDRHDRDFPNALLGPEVTVLRIEALAKSGDRAGASRLGAAFLAAHPRSPLANRVRSLTGATPEP